MSVESNSLLGTLLQPIKQEHLSRTRRGQRLRPIVVGEEMLVEELGIIGRKRGEASIGLIVEAIRSSAQGRRP
jgi:hypothetical protein